MAYPIEVLCIGGDNYNKVEKVIHLLNSQQEEFIYILPPLRIRYKGLSFDFDKYKKEEVLEFLENYRKEVKGHRPFIIALVEGNIKGNLFGSTIAEKGLAFFNIHDRKYLKSQYAYLAYYLIRYTLGFIQPAAKTHEDTRGCFFDYKGKKTEIKASVRKMKACDEHMRILQPSLTDEIYDSLLNKLSKTVKKMEKFWYYYEVKYFFKIERVPNTNSDTSWVLTASLISTVLSALIFYYTRWFDLSLLSFILISVFILLRNPRWRFFRLGSSLLSLSALSTLPIIITSFSLGIPDRFNLALELFSDQSPLIPLGLLISGTLFIAFDFMKNK